jgi:hypothetical protein
MMRKLRENLILLCQSYMATAMTRRPKSPANEQSWLSIVRPKRKADTGSVRCF